DFLIRSGPTIGTFHFIFYFHHMLINTHTMKYLLLPALALLLVQCIGSKEDKTVSKDLYGQRIGGSYRNSHFHFGLEVDSSWTIKKRGYQNRFHPDLFEADFFHPELPEDYNSINITIEAEKANPF